MSAKLTKKMWGKLRELEDAASNWCSKCDYLLCDGCGKFITIDKLITQMNGNSKIAYTPKEANENESSQRRKADHDYEV